MGRTAGRSSEETRLAILAAAGVVLRTKGIQATLTEVASEAGISKGGLVYHFSSKEDLLLSLAGDIIARFRSAVAMHLDPADRSAGRLARAYIRCCLNSPLLVGDSAVQGQIGRQDALERETMAILAQLVTLPGARRLLQADAARWERELEADGLCRHVTFLVVVAADGASNAALWSSGDRAKKTELETYLLNLTYGGSCCGQDVMLPKDPRGGKAEVGIGPKGRSEDVG